MSVADVAAVDAALIATLAGDATLAALVPDGVYLDIAPAATPPKTRFVIVQAQTHEDLEAFGTTALYEEFRYRVTARVLESTGVTANAAAARIHALLHDQALAPITGYTHMATLRVERVKFPEVDAIDNDIRWQIAGGDYEITVSPGDVVPPLVPYADQVIADGASHYWRLGDLGGTIAIDEVGFAHGTVSGGVTLNQPGAVADGDTAMTFDGTTGKIVTVTAVPLVPPYTVEVWVRPMAASMYLGMVANEGANQDQHIVAIYNTNQLVWRCSYLAGGQQHVTMSRELIVGRWSHVVVVCTGSAVLMYLDGGLEPTIYNPTTMAPTTGATLNPITLGLFSGFYLNGSLDEIAIYPRALTPAEITAHYAAATTARRARSTR